MWRVYLAKRGYLHPFEGYLWLLQKDNGLSGDDVMIDYGVGDVVVAVAEHDETHVCCPACGIKGPRIEKGSFYRVRHMTCDAQTVTWLDSGVGVQLVGIGCDCWFFCAWCFKKPGEAKDIFSLAEPSKVKEPSRELVPVNLYDSLERSWHV